MTTDTTYSSRTRGILALAALALPTLLVAVDISVLAVALPTMGRELHASATELLWMTDSYNFMVAGAMLTTGAIADRIGRRRMILVCAAIFAIASGIGAFATTPELVIAARGVMGLAGSAILPASMALLGGLFTDEKSRIQAMGAMMTVFLGGMAIAPFVGGAAPRPLLVGLGLPDGRAGDGRDDRGRAPADPGVQGRRARAARPRQRRAVGLRRPEPGLRPQARREHRLRLLGRWSPLVAGAGPGHRVPASAGARWRTR